MSEPTVTAPSSSPEAGSLISIPPTTTPPADSAAPPVVTPPAEPVAPVVLTADHIKVPEGFTLPDTDRDTLLGLFNDQNLTAEQRLQKLVEFGVEREKNSAAAQEKAWADTQKSWADAVRADPEIGGDKLEPALGEIAKLTQHYGSPELLEVFTLTGAGNNVHMVKFLSKIANDLKEGTPVSGAPATPGKSLAQSLFPSMK